MADTTMTPADAPKKRTTARKADTVTAAAAAPVATDAAADTSAKGRFSKAIEEAKAGAEALRGEAMEKGAAYKAKVGGTATDWMEEAKVYAGQAKEKGAALAVEGKTRASDALSTLGKTISDNAATIDEKLGVQYGDYARTAARSIQETAAKLEAKDLNELGDDVKEFVRKSPGVAIGIAAVAGFAIARMLSGGSDD
ncbi:hypothetical protein Saro_2224 [Novosphingobium aromaticivorans DSM 12444]|uniref:DUF883 domain-containing protein n=1 Tax=Novosphingobium aromaticivorans (strain ATCC 700278 / DSM 12444 / CCUG 56034 / CIP 105152 / NBRC 16084 / F199) TaxID=279238 RepID=Q2G661_NOVAD|nr:hypothetical protein [Novosphingobium aromaticivorans]ABD26662.1 hypothetical protein Saro_2224 [Novosphingobium aromaticivorans DSM 12444]SCY38503.1 hypothetical protein SAMN05660666_01474 [Novosphingobium aromaticivorans]